MDSPVPFGVPLPPGHRRQPQTALPEFFTPERLARRRAAMARDELQVWKGVDATDSQGAAGHARGLRISVALTSDYRQARRKDAMDIKPQEVIDVLTAAGVKKWVLMGLHGYVGYLPQPRATQDVDLLISHRDRRRAVKALQQAWPQLVVEPLEAVVRFRDPNDCFADEHPKIIIDVMLPWCKLSNAILEQERYVVVDRETSHTIPILEAALAAKYAAMISDTRAVDKRDFDAGDFRRMVRANYEHIRRQTLRRLGDLVWEEGGRELEEFVELAWNEQPFPI